MDPALLLVAGLAIILLLQFSRVRRQQREVRATQAALDVGSEVVTASGMVGTVVALSGATLTLAGPDGGLTRWVSGAVVRVLPDTDPASSRYLDPTTLSTTDPAEGPDGDPSATDPDTAPPADRRGPTTQD